MYGFKLYLEEYKKKNQIKYDGESINKTKLM